MTNVPSREDPAAKEQSRKHRRRDLRRAYLDSTRESVDRAKQFAERQDHFTAHLYAFVALNNLYRWLGSFEGTEQGAYVKAIRSLPDDVIRSIYSREFFAGVQGLNDRTTAEFPTERGIVNMKLYLRGDAPGERGLIVRLSNVAGPDGTLEEQKATLEELFAILFAVRNNQFHGIKSPIVDEQVLELACKLLIPMTESLLQVAEEGQ